MQHTTAAFPDVYRDVPLARLLAAFDTAPARLRAAVAGLTEGQLRARPRPGKWSILEIALHLADADIVGAGRFRHAIAQPGVAVVGYDQDAWADALAYNGAPLSALAEALDLFASLRRSAAALFGRASADGAWGRVVHHPERGAVTLRNLLELYADHGDRHIAQILANRALLGVPPRRASSSCSPSDSTDPERGAGAACGGGARRPRRGDRPAGGRTAGGAHLVTDSCSGSWRR